MRHLLPAAAAGALLLAGCGSDATTPATPAAATKITIAGFAYSPTPATVKLGTPIAIANRDDAPHTLTDRATDRAFDSGTIKGHAAATVTFDRPGTFAYFCEFHPYMKGSVTVRR